MPLKIFPPVNMFLLTKWEGRMGKYLARGYGVRTERSEVRTIRPDLTWSISILLYDQIFLKF